MPKNKGEFFVGRTGAAFVVSVAPSMKKINGTHLPTPRYIMTPTGKGGKNRRRGKNENEETKRDLIFKEDGQGAWS